MLVQVLENVSCWLNELNVGVYFALEKPTHVCLKCGDTSSWNHCTTIASYCVSGSCLGAIRAMPRGAWTEAEDRQPSEEAKTFSRRKAAIASACRIVSDSSDVLRLHAVNALNKAWSSIIFCVRLARQFVDIFVISPASGALFAQSLEVMGACFLEEFGQMYEATARRCMNVKSAVSYWMVAITRAMETLWLAFGLVLLFELHWSWTLVWLSAV